MRSDKPKPSLENIIEQYESTIQKKRFCYELSNGQTVKIVIYKEQICHLIGLQHIYGRDKHYLGAKGYEKLAKGEITINSLKQHNSKQYNYIKDRIIYFDRLYDVLTEGSLIRFYPERTDPQTKLNADFIVYKNGEKHIYHLFLKQERIECSDVYAPLSFIVKSVTEKNSQQYLKNQEYKKIEKITIESIK